MSVLAGVLALRWPYFDALAAVLAACAAVAGLLRASGQGHGVGVVRAAPRRWGPWLVPGVIAAGWAFFLLSPSSVAELRGLSVALGAVGLWLWLGRTPRSREVGG